MYEFFGPEQEATRSRNRSVVDRYMNTRGTDRLKRHELFTQDGEGGLWTTETGEPIMIKGRDRLADHAVWSLERFPDWSWFNVEIFDTQDPDRFWVECDGAGIIRFAGYPEGRYENHFIHFFRFVDGKISQQREFMNPCQQFRALGIAVPNVIREGIPT
ncbi:PhzA/PhzB family protein [Rhodococcus sp. C3V]|uniref:PhzA/PhzB family protein n=1 Tax=Rhodococcus sp. C3V TaxID=3034165 RepID=UPI0023E26963|nr:PhzA/PhzB family protein [Rhodococcus sp. C3V]MDF3320020.1 PhzA/PhzB family protein [Rhodococcus sp. C3V]